MGQNPKEGDYRMKLLPVNMGRRVRFALSAKPGSKVFVAGTFNKWNPTANPLTDAPDSGQFKLAMHVPKGAHEYKFVVNGIWTADPKCTNSAPNAYGSMNSMLKV